MLGVCLSVRQQEVIARTLDEFDDTELPLSQLFSEGDLEPFYPPGVLPSQEESDTQPDSDENELLAPLPKKSKTSSVCKPSHRVTRSSVH